MTSKQRSNLRALAHSLSPHNIVGKDGLSENVLKQINDSLEAHELIKVQVLPNCGTSARNLAEELALRSRSEIVQVIGNKITLYRYSHRDGVKHIVF